MKNKIVLITGATSGIGKTTAFELANKGAHIVMIGRNVNKTKAVAAELNCLPGNPKVDYLIADLSLMAEVKRAAKEYRSRFDRLDVLFNNAGAIFMKHQLTAEGLEKTFAVNHMSYFLLPNLLLDLLAASAPARVINTSSVAHFFTRLTLDDLHSEHAYSGFKVYAQTKLMNICFTYELARRLDGKGVTVNCFHPGYVATNLGANNNGLFSKAFSLGGKLIGLTPEQGAKTGIYLASSPKVAGISGKYFNHCKPVKSSPLSYNPKIAAALWQKSIEISGIEEHMLLKSEPSVN